MKPDWKNAPEWAQYLAHELDGAWFWFLDEPQMTAGGCLYGKAYCYASRCLSGPMSIEKRPCAKS
jgi:hypothetical protein